MTFSTPQIRTEMQKGKLERASPLFRNNLPLPLIEGEGDKGDRVT